MPVFLLIGIPIAVVVILMGIMSLPDEEPKKEMSEPAPKKKISKKK